MIIKKQIKVHNPYFYNTEERLRNEFLPLNIQDVDMFNNYNYVYHADVQKTINSGCLLITNNINTYDIFVWCYFHLNIIHFDRIILIDNTEHGLHRNLQKIFGYKIEYKHQPGTIYQNEIYNTYTNNTNIKWLLPIDDDEYLYISEKYNNDINVFIKEQQKLNPCDKYAFKWHIMFSKQPMKTRNFTASILELFKYSFKNVPDKIYNDKHVRYAFPFVKTLVNTELKHLYLNDNGNKKHFAIADFMSNVYPEENLTFAKNIFFDIVGSVHNPITYKNNQFVFAYNPETDQYYNGMYSEFSFDETTDACLYHFKYRTEDEYNYKCINFKFPNILTSHVKEKYNNSHYNAVHELIDGDLCYDGRLAALYRKHLTEIKQIYNKYYNSMHFCQSIFTNNTKQYDAVIALTSWKNRIASVYGTIKSIMANNKHNYLFVLTLSSDEFPDLENGLPDELFTLKNLKILWVKENAKSFKKYLFTMQMYRTLPIMTADDGCIYKSNSFDVLYDNWKRAPENIYCYIYWLSYFTDQRIRLYSVNSGTGIIFPPHAFDGTAIKILNEYLNFLLITNEDDFFTTCLIKMFNKTIIKLPDFNKISDIYSEIDELAENKISNNEIFKDLKKIRRVKLDIIIHCFKPYFPEYI